MSQTYSKNMYAYAYVVMMGNVGTGKSTLVEKITAVTGQSSSSSESFTRESKLFWSKDRRLLMNDTPGANPLVDKLQHNLQIAAAFDYEPVSKIFIVVKADTRIDTTIHHIREYAEQLVELELELIGAIVTHMDTVSWNESRLRQALYEELAIGDLVFSGGSTTGEQLQEDILRNCRQKHRLDIYGKEFFKIFKITDSNFKILKSTKRLVDIVREMRKKFDEQRPRFNESKSDLLFEFQAFMMTEVIEWAKKELAKENDFTFIGDGAAVEVGHVANMTNQLRAILYDVRVETLEQAAADHGINDLRKCPHCGEVWAKIVGCAGETTCGNLVNELDAVHDGTMATFKFEAKIAGGLHSFKIERSGQKQVQKHQQKGTKVGCGKTINWSEMARVKVPTEYQAVPAVHTKDISVLPKNAVGFAREIDRSIKNIKQNMPFGN